MLKGLIGLMVCFLPLSALAETGAIEGHSYLGGTKAVTSGLSSTNYLNGIIPSATITVYLTGTQTLATIYSDANNTPLGNPFTSNAASSVNPGGFLFWASKTQGYDIVLSGGIAPNTYPASVTITAIFPSGGGTLGNLIPETTPFTVVPGNSSGYAQWGSAAVATLPPYANSTLIPFRCVGPGAVCVLNSGVSNIIDECTFNPNSPVVVSSFTYSSSQNVGAWSNGTNWEVSCPSVPANLPPIYVTSFGTAGNGSTNDQAAIQNAINAGATYNAPVVFPAGTYLVAQAGSSSYALSIPSNAHLIGFPGSHLKLAPTGSNQVRLLSSTSTSNVIIEGLDIDGNNSAQTSGAQQDHCIFADSVSNWKVRDNHIHDCDGDGVFTYSSTAASQNVEEYGNTFTGVFRDAVDIDGGTQIDVHDNRFLDFTSGAGAIHGEDDTGMPQHDIDIHDNLITTAVADTANISFTGYSASNDLPNFGNINIHDNQLFGSNEILLWALPHSRVAGNTISNSLNSGTISQYAAIINIGTFDTDVSGNTVTFTGVTPASGVSAGIEVACNSYVCPAAGYGKDRITGNTVTLARSSGIQIDASSDNTISGNTVNGVLQASSYAVGIQISNALSANNHVSDNRILDSQGSPTTLYAFDFSGAAASQTEGPDQITNMVDGAYYSGSVANIISPSGIFPLPNPNQSTIDGLPNDPSLATVLYELATTNGGLYNYVGTISAGSTGGAVGIVIANAGTTGYPTIQINGLVNCVFDGATTSQDYVQISPTANGECHDSGVAYPAYPTSGQVIGRVQSTNGGAGTYSIYLFPSEIQGVPALQKSSGSQVANQVACIKATGPPVVIGTCAGTVNATTGACGTCN